jgi:hypothetical protein
MKLTSLILVILVLCCSAAPKDGCENGCSTTFQIVDCNGSPVANAKVTIRLCCGDKGEISSTTDSNGNATFAYCLKDICERKIIMENGYGASADDCNTKGDNSTCKIKVCSSTDSHIQSGVSMHAG